MPPTLTDCTWRRSDVTAAPGDPETLYAVTEPMDGDSLLALMEKRRTAFWQATPDNEKSHYQGYSSISRAQLLNSLKRQCHAELAAVPRASLVPLPEGATFAEGAGFLLTFLTAYVPLTRQVQIVSDNAKGCVARLAARAATWPWTSWCTRWMIALAGGCCWRPI